MPVVTFRDVTVAYEDKLVLDQINLTLSEQRVGIVGANGGGKSTLIRLINGLNEPTAGTVRVGDLDVATQGAQVRQKVGFVFSDAENQIVMPEVAQDIAFSLRRFKLSKEEKQRRVEAAMAQFGLSNHAKQSPHTLSGGQKQMLALAAVTVMEPELIIADEPTTLLDLRNRLKLQEFFKQLPQQLFVVTHDLDFIADFDRVIMIDEHQVAADGSPDEVLPYYRRKMGA